VGHPQLSQLRALEAESIHILREVAGQFARPVLLYSIGKDSSTLLHLARKAFFPGKLPFPLLHIDTTYEYPELIEFRDWFVAEIGAELIVYTNRQAVAAGANPYDLGASRRKLLALASVLAMRTPVLVLDEPTTGQDLAGVAIVRGVVEAAEAEGRTVIAISHDMAFVAETFERVVVMRAGRIVLDGPPASVFAEESWQALRSTYLEPPLAAVAGARLGLGSTPTDEALIAALG